MDQIYSAIIIAVKQAFAGAAFGMPRLGLGLETTFQTTFFNLIELGRWPID
jgi:hypothetical protein